MKWIYSEWVLTYHVDALLFAGLSLAGLLAVHRRLRRRNIDSGGGSGVPRWAWGVLLLLIVGGLGLAHASGESERSRLRGMLEGIAPTYAMELERLGHARLSLDAAADDPLYLTLIDAQRRWLAANPRVADIYTAGEFPPIEGLSQAPVPHFAVSIQPKVLADAARGIASRTKPILQHLLLDESNAETVRVAATTLDNITRAEARSEEGGFPAIDDVTPTPGREGNIYDHQRHGNLAFSHVRVAVDAKRLKSAETCMMTHHTVALTVPVSGPSPIRLEHVRRAGGGRNAAQPPDSGSHIAQPGYGGEGPHR